jgi:1,4-alpha-glucan branching enzyme
VSVIGSFDGWNGQRNPLRAEDAGIWYADVAGGKAGDQYKFLLATAEGELTRIDPYAREVVNSVGNAVIHDPTFGWGGDDFHLPPGTSSSCTGFTWARSMTKSTAGPANSPRSRPAWTI